MAILLNNKSIVEAVVKNGAEEADCQCKQYLFRLVNHLIDTLIGRNTSLKAMDIAIVMRMQKIYDILSEKRLTGVRFGRTTTCDLC